MDPKVGDYRPKEAATRLASITREAVALEVVKTVKALHQRLEQPSKA